MSNLRTRVAVDLSFRPETYWPVSPNRETLLSRIKGIARRTLARTTLEQERFLGLNTFLAREDLTSSDRESWGRIHPLLMGGEYLPDLADGEVEIVRISLQSTTGDQISLRAREIGQKIHYLVVDEYETSYEQPFYEHDCPLTLQELVGFLDHAVHPGDIYEGGLIESQWNCWFDGCGDLDEALAFVAVESAFYSELPEYYDEAGLAWAQRQKVEHE